MFTIPLSVTHHLFILFYSLWPVLAPGRSIPDLQVSRATAVIAQDGLELLALYLLFDNGKDEELEWQFLQPVSPSSPSSLLALNRTRVPNISPLFSWTKKSLVFIININGAFLLPALGENLDSCKFCSMIVFNNIGWRDTLQVEHFLNHNLYKSIFLL